MSVMNIHLKTGPYIEYLRLTFLSLFAYRANYFLGVINYIIHVGVYYFIYKALFSGGGNINNYTLSDMVTYISIGWISKSLYLNYMDRDIADDVRNGTIAMDLIKPLDYQLLNYARGLGQSLFRLLFFTPPIVIVTFLLYPVHGPSSLFNLFLFSISTFLSILLYVGLNFCIGLIAVYTISIEGIIYPKNMIIELFSGLLVPIDWFPRWFQYVSSCLPFKYIAFVPLSLYLGKTNTALACRALLIQLIWVIFFFTGGKILWILCRKKIAIHGG